MQCKRNGENHLLQDLTVLVSKCTHDRSGSWGSLEKRRIKVGFITLYIYLKGDRSKLGVSLFSQETSYEVRGNGLMLCHEGRFRLGIGKKFYNKRMVKPWNRLPREQWKRHPWEELKKHVNVMLRDTVSWWTWK